MLQSNEDIDNFIKEDGFKLLLISSPICPHCIKADELLKKSPNTLNVCFNHIGVCYFNNAKEFCKKNGVSVTPTFIVYDNEGNEVSRISYTPKDQDEFFEWISSAVI